MISLLIGGVVAGILMLMGRDQFVALDYGANIALYSQILFTAFISLFGILAVIAGIISRSVIVAGGGMLLVLLLPLLNGVSVLGNYLICVGVTPEEIQTAPVIIGVVILVACSLMSINMRSKD